MGQLRTLQGIIDFICLVPPADGHCALSHIRARMSASTVSSAPYSAFLSFLLSDRHRAGCLLGRLFCQSQLAKALRLRSHSLTCVFQLLL